jgi:hypothetical protein
MQIYLFWSQRDLGVFGFTSDHAGANLPVEFMPWSKNGDGEALYTGPNEASNPANVIIEAVQRHGFRLARCASLSVPWPSAVMEP